jgi:hypothetical protein
MLGAIALTSLWELRAYRNSVAKATGLFPLGDKLLRNNAITASYYMALGAVAGHVIIAGGIVAAEHEMPWVQILSLLALVAFGAYNRQRLMPRIAASAAAGGAALRASVTREIFVMALVILLGGLLAYVPPPGEGDEESMSTHQSTS